MSQSKQNLSGMLIKNNSSLQRTKNEVKKNICTIESAEKNAHICAKLRKKIKNMRIAPKCFYKSGLCPRQPGLRALSDIEGV